MKSTHDSWLGYGGQLTNQDDRYNESITNSSSSSGDKDDDDDATAKTKQQRNNQSDGKPRAKVIPRMTDVVRLRAGGCRDFGGRQTDGQTI